MSARGVSRRAILIAPATVLRRGVKQALEELGWLEIVETVEDTAGALSILEHTQPDLILVSLSAGARLEGIAQASDRARFILIMDEGRTVEELQRMLQAQDIGGLITPTDPFERVEQVLSAAVVGHTVLPGWLATTMLGRKEPAWSRAATPSHPVGSLTSRQIEVLEHVAHGLANQDIGAALNIRVSTVKSHVHTIFRKLGVQSRSDAAKDYWDWKQGVKGDRMVQASSGVPPPTS